jgi:hypothetical protein
LYPPIHGSGLLRFCWRAPGTRRSTFTLALPFGKHLSDLGSPDDRALAVDLVS